MPKIIPKTAIALTLVSGLAFSGLAVKNYSQSLSAKEALTENPQYRQCVRLAGYKAKIENASQLLQFSPGGGFISALGMPLMSDDIYPNPLSAKACLRAVVTCNTSYPEINPTLDSVSNSLPGQNDLRALEGKNVNNLTFASVRQSLDSCAREMGAVAVSLSKAVPSSLIKTINDYTSAALINALLALGAFFSGLAGTLKYLVSEPKKAPES